MFKIFLCAGVATGLLLVCSPSVAAQVEHDGYEQASLHQVRMDAEAGNGQAQFEMGRRYYFIKTMKDDALARQWFLKAAQQGVRGAQYELATMYILGEGGSVDAAQAMIWYRKAAALGYVAANYDIGGMYLNGEGVPVDEAEAAKWLRIAADLGERRAQYHLALLYRDGRGVQKDAEQAILLLKASVKQKYLPAAEALEVMYRDGQGVAKDPVTSHAWRTMAAWLREPPKRLNAGEADYALLSTPKLSLEDNIRAWRMYAGFMHEFGFSKDEKTGTDGRTAEDAARDFLTHPAEGAPD